MRLLVALRLAIPLLLTAAVAKADVPPEPGKKRVPVRYRIVSIPKGGMHVWTVPCGTGEQGPNHRWFEVKEGEPMPVGRFAGGTCAVYAMTHEKFTAYLGAREEAGVDVIQAAIKNSVPCSGIDNLFFQDEIAGSDPRSSSDVTFRVSALGPTECKLTSEAPSKAASSGSTPLPVEKSRCGCSSHSPRDALFPAGIAAAALVLVRRRRTRHAVSRGPR